MFWVRSLFRVDIFDLPQGVSPCGKRRGLQRLLRSQRVRKTSYGAPKKQWFCQVRCCRLYDLRGSPWGREGLLPGRQWWTFLQQRVSWDQGEYSLFENISNNISPMNRYHKNLSIVWAIDCTWLYFYKNRSCLELWAGASAVPELDTQESTLRLFYSSTNQHWFLYKMLQRSGRHPLVLFSNSTVLHKFV